MLIQRNYVELFHIVVKALRQDYAGARDKAALDDPNPHTNRVSRAMIDGLAFDSTLVFNLNAYLAAFKDAQLHLHVDPSSSYYKPFSRGFEVRRSDEGLFVTRCTRSQHLKPGDRLIKVGEFSVNELVRKFGASLYGDIPERELWTWLLQSYKMCRVKRKDGSKEMVELEKFFTPEPLENYFETPAEGVACLHLEDFSDDQDIPALLQAHHEEITGCKKLILDIRRAQGRDELAVIALLPYLFPEPVSPAGILGARGLQTMYTKRNCELLKQRLHTMISESGEEEQPWVQEMLAELDAKAGTGMQDDIDEIPDEWREPLTVYRNGYEVVILSDTYCHGVAETLLARCHEAGVAKIVGRPSLGDLGYCHPVTVTMDKAFSFTYPISRTDDADMYAARGVPVDDYIPWSKEEIEQDIVLAWALEA